MAMIGALAAAAGAARGEKARAAAAPWRQSLSVGDKVLVKESCGRWQEAVVTSASEGMLMTAIERGTKFQTKVVSRNSPDLRLAGESNDVAEAKSEPELWSQGLVIGDMVRVRAKNGQWEEAVIVSASAAQLMAAITHGNRVRTVVVCRDSCDLRPPCSDDESDATGLPVGPSAQPECDSDPELWDSWALRPLRGGGSDWADLGSSVQAEPESDEEEVDERLWRLGLSAGDAVSVRRAAGQWEEAVVTDSDENVVKTVLSFGTKLRTKVVPRSSIDMRPFSRQNSDCGSESTDDALDSGFASEATNDASGDEGDCCSVVYRKCLLTVAAPYMPVQ